MRAAGHRAAAAVAAILFVAGGALVAVALAASADPWTGGYVSEAGVAGYPQAAAYRSGILVISLGLVLLSAGLTRLVMVAGLLIAAAGVLGGVSASVRCSAGCPLPPYEQPTAADLVHGGASIAAVAFVALAMLVTAMRANPLTRLSRWWFAATAPLLAALGVALLTVGRSTFTAGLERIALIAVLGWLIAAAIDRAAGRVSSTCG